MERVGLGGEGAFSSEGGEEASSPREETRGRTGEGRRAAGGRGEGTRNQEASLPGEGNAPGESEGHARPLDMAAVRAIARGSSRPALRGVTERRLPTAEDTERSPWHTERGRHMAQLFRVPTEKQGK